MSRFLYILPAVVAGILLLELLARLWLRHFEKYYLLLPGQRLKITLDPNFFHCLKSPVFHFINRDGERGGEVPRSRAELYRVLVVGGSAAACALLDQDKTWSAVLEQLLNRPEALARLGARRVHVGCAGKSLLDTQALPRVLERVLPRYRRLDLVVLWCGVADLLSWLAQGAPEGVAPEPLPDDQCYAAYPTRPLGWRPAQTALAAAYRRVRPYVFRRTRHLADAGRTIRAEASARASVTAFTPLTQDPSEAMRACRESMRAACEIASRCAGRVLVMQPPCWKEATSTPDEEKVLLWHGRIGGQKNGPPRFLSPTDLCRLVSLAASAVSEAAAQARTEQISVQQALDELPQAFYDRVHLTEAGARAVAQEVAAVVLNGRAPETTGADAHAGSRDVP